MRRSLPLAFYFNSLAMGCFFLAVWVARWRGVLQVMAGVALVCGIVLLIMKK
jgi:hypothetical protein